MQSALLALDSINKSFQQGKTHHEVLQSITVSFQQSHTYAIMGVSGTGKSTLMHIIAGLDTPTRGKVFFNDHDINKMSESGRNTFRNQSIGLLFQQPYLIRELTVQENVMMPALIAGLSSSVCQERANELLEAVGLAEKIHSAPGSLSGGQQQRVALARALCNRPKFLLADEPTGNLDKATGKLIIELLIRLQKEWDMGIIVSSHDQYVSEAMNTCFTLQNGSLIKDK